MSAVQVFHADQMVAVAHLVGIDQLPTSKMVRACTPLYLYLGLEFVTSLVARLVLGWVTVGRRVNLRGM